MPYDSIERLPVLIRERLDASGYVDVNIAIGSQFAFSDEQQQALMLLENDILTKRVVPSALPDLLVSRLGLDASTAKKISIELLGNYFLLFQDFLGRVDELLAVAGAQVSLYQERARRLLSPHRQLQTFLREFLADTPLENIGEDVQGELIEAILDRALEKIYDRQFKDRVAGILLKTGLPTDAGSYLIDSIEVRIGNQELNNHWAEYYRNLADAVIAGTQGHFEESDELLAANEGEHRQEPSLLFLLRQFEQLPEEVKKQLTSASVREGRAAIEAQFGVDLETIILRAAVRDFSLADLPIVIKKECKVSPETASQIKDAMMRLVFEPVLSYYTAMSIHVVGEDDTAKLKIQNDKESEPKTSNLSPLTSNPPPIDWRTLMSPVAVPSGPVSFPTTEEYSALADTLIQEATLPGISSLLEARLRQILMTRIKNIRTIVETKEKLLGSEKMGGIGLSDEDAEALLFKASELADLIASGRYEEIKKKAVPVEEDLRVPTIDREFVPPLEELEYEEVSEAKPIVSLPEQIQEAEEEEEEKADEPPTLSIEEVDGLPMLVERQVIGDRLEVRGRGVGGGQEGESKKREVHEEIKSVDVKPEPPKLESPRQEQPRPQPWKQELVKPEPPTQEPQKPEPSKPQPVPVVADQKPQQLPQGSRTVIATEPSRHPALADAKPIPVIIRATNSQPAKVAITDVRPSLKLVDTAEELRIMTLKDFRRLSADPLRRSRRFTLKSSFWRKNLHEEKARQSTHGRKNDISKLYREMGEESFGAGHPIDQVIKDRSRQERKRYEAEFDALLELNEMLRT